MLNYKAKSMFYPCSGKNYRTVRISDSKSVLMLLLYGTDGGILLVCVLEVIMTGSFAISLLSSAFL